MLGYKEVSVVLYLHTNMRSRETAAREICINRGQTSLTMPVLPKNYIKEVMIIIKRTAKTGNGKWGTENKFRGAGKYNDRYHPDRPGSIICIDALNSKGLHAFPHLQPKWLHTGVDRVVDCHIHFINRPCVS